MLFRSLANCVACPSISSFVSFNKRKDVWASQEQLLETTLYNTFEDRYLTIDRSSNHADYRTGETLIWYPEVKEIEGEGYTVYNFKMHCRDNVFYTHPIDHNPLYLYTIFSSGPLETSRKTYNTSGRLVQSVERTYKLIELEKNWLNQSIGREYIQTADDYLSPDFDENRKIVFPYEIGRAHV